MSASSALRVAIVGGTGYGGMELLRWLLGHPEVEVTAITSRTQSGRVADVHGQLRGFTDLEFSVGRAVDLARHNDVLFFATPHGVAAKEAPVVLQAASHVKLIDLSGDFRLANGAAYAEHYGGVHPHPELLGQVPYGLPECGHRDDVAAARLVANPGCHATATILAVWPLLQAGLVRGRVSACSVTGSSGSGAQPGAGTHHPERCGNFKAYKPLAHQHEPEIALALRGDVAVDFVPHSAPFARGIHVTAHVPLELDDARQPGAGDGGEAPAVSAAFEQIYGAEPFVRLTPGTPQVRHVAGTNLADVAVTTRRFDALAGEANAVACVMVAIDNLGKGMAGTAVQNMNLMCGLDERAGLHHAGMGL